MVKASLLGGIPTLIPSNVIHAAFDVQRLEHKKKGFPFVRLQAEAWRIGLVATRYQSRSPKEVSSHTTPARQSSSQKEKKRRHSTMTMSTCPTTRKFKFPFKKWQSGQKTAGRQQLSYNAKCTSYVICALFFPKQ